MIYHLSVYDKTRNCWMPACCCENDANYYLVYHGLIDLKEIDCEECKKTEVYKNRLTELIVRRMTR